jgi:hypothetical protein
LRRGSSQDRGSTPVGKVVGFPASNSENMSHTGGRYLPIGWSMLPAIVAILVVAGIAALVASIVTGGPWWFFILWLAGVGWFAVHGLYRTSYELKFDSIHLYWRGFLRSGNVPVSEIVGIDSEFLGEIAVFICRDGQRIRVVVLQGFVPFLKALNEAHPSLGAAPSWYARLVERAQWKP